MLSPPSPETAVDTRFCLAPVCGSRCAKVIPEQRGAVVIYGEVYNSAFIDGAAPRGPCWVQLALHAAQAMQVIHPYGGERVPAARSRQKAIYFI